MIDSDDPTIVAEEIKTIFQNKRALKNVEMAGRRQVIENFSVRAMVGAYKDLLSQNRVTNACENTKVAFYLSI